jgi:hypothetical protein
MKRFFSFDPNAGFDTYNTAEEARIATEGFLDEEREEAGEGWSEEVTQICWGEIRQATKETDLGPAPHGSDYDRYINYVLVDVPPEPQA